MEFDEYEGIAEDEVHNLSFTTAHLWNCERHLLDSLSEQDYART